ncbi:hypothetical protein [Alteromonas stellipolaris]|jgi:hypothetical protein|uniref:Uncharacterized protein n=1 Tax=Alteromonas stellipolaris TaxID=233316 RepID=A0ABN4LWF4_9ALTE|nr:hypothetical protein AVL57_00485 [Alteromonas stellipolaris]
MSTIQKWYKKAAATVVIAATDIGMAQAADVSSADEIKTNWNTLLKIVTIVITGGIALWGLIIFISALSTILSKNPQDSKLMAVGKIIIGIIMFSPLAIILALNTSLLGGSEAATSSGYIRE